MSRKPAQAYHHPPMARLARQLLFAPPEKRISQVLRAEKLHDQIDASAEYPLEFVSYRITGYRSEEEVSELMAGRLLPADIRLLIDTLSRSVDMRSDEPGETTQELADRLHVSTKTLTRWRELGLRWRWVVRGEGGVRTLVYPRSAVDAFVKSHETRVEKAARFTKLSEYERERIILRAKRLAAGRDLSLFRVAAHLARRTHRATETIRLLLEDHEHQHPRHRIFADHTGPLTEKQKRVIVRAHRKGVTVGKMAVHFHRTPSTIHRALRERRAIDLRAATIEYQTSATFFRPEADEIILRPESDPSLVVGRKGIEGAPATVVNLIDELPEAIRPVFKVVWIEPDLQRTLSIRMNYLKFKADRVREAMSQTEPRAAELDLIERCIWQGVQIRCLLCESCAWVALSVARRQMLQFEDRSIHLLMDLLELAIKSLSKAVDEFEPARGQTLDDFVRWSLMRRMTTYQPAPSKAHRRVEPEEFAVRLRAAMMMSHDEAASRKGGQRYAPGPDIPEHWD